ncbi:MAG: hypothetical protein ABIU20_00885 [Blastocatellia bacterium]
MKQVKAVIITILAIFLLGGIAIGQTRSRQKAKPVRATPVIASTPSKPLPSGMKQSVSIKMKNGDLLIGNLLRRDNQTVQVELTKGPQIIRLSDIETLTYLPNEKATSNKPDAKADPEVTVNQSELVADKAMANGRRAYVALRKLAAAAQYGLPYSQYGSVLIETKVIFDEALTSIPEGAVKAGLAAAMAAYTDAGQAWGGAQGLGALPIAIEPGATLMKKYSIKPAVNALGQEDRLMLDVALTTIWAAANTQLNNVMSLLKL